MHQRVLPFILLAILVHPCNAQTRVEYFQRVVQPYVDAKMFMGSVLVAKEGKPVFSRGYDVPNLCGVGDEVFRQALARTNSNSRDG